MARPWLDHLPTLLRGQVWLSRREQRGHIGCTDEALELRVDVAEDGTACLMLRAAG
jgi:hypothetical protein